jgi:DNA uptake protein ComE-like DNA-binding protein
MIVNRRIELGGFYSGEQLREIENIPDSVVDTLAPYIIIELDSVKMINVNKASIKRLHRHPYINYYQAKAIYDLRWDKHHKGKIENLNEIRKLDEFTNEEFERVKWYLKIGD